MHMETSLLAGIMIYNFKNYLRIVWLHRHHKKPVSSFFSATASREKHFSLYKQIYMVLSILLGLKLLWILLHFFYLD